MLLLKIIHHEKCFHHFCISLLTEQCILRLTARHIFHSTTFCWCRTISFHPDYTVSPRSRKHASTQGQEARPVLANLSSMMFPSVWRYRKTWRRSTTESPQEPPGHHWSLLPHKTKSGTFSAAFLSLVPFVIFRDRLSRCSRGEKSPGWGP